MKKDKLYLKSLKLAAKIAKATKQGNDKFNILEFADSIYNEALRKL